jgi:hypothetical protein
MKKIIYVQLLDEGSVAYRPVFAYEIGCNIFKILGTEQGLTPEDLDEKWEFLPNTYVVAEKQTRSEENILVAIKELKPPYPDISLEKDD